MALRFLYLFTKLEEFAPRDPIRTRSTSTPAGRRFNSRAHIGNFRAYIFEDLLQRHLEARGFKFSA